LPRVDAGAATMAPRRIEVMRAPSTIASSMALTPDLERQLARFKRLPQVEDIWEGGVVRLPAWIDDDPRLEPRRPTAALWISLSSRAAHVKGSAGADEVETALAALFE